MSKKKSPLEWEVIRFLKGVNPNDQRHQKAVYRALQFLYERQTPDEKAVIGTVWNNQMGFNGFDAPFLSDVAQKSKQYKRLTPKQTEVIAKKLVKYAKQLSELAASKPQPKPVQLELPA